MGITGVVIGILALALYSKADGDIEFVVHIANHGTRYPLRIRGEWVELPGALTQVGMRQMYILGREFRKRYIEDNDLLDEQYNPTQLIVRASAFNRTTTSMSAYAFLRGLYVPGSGYALNKEQTERAVPPTTLGDFKPYQQELRDAAVLNYFASVPVMIHTGGPDYPMMAPIYCENVPKLIDRYIQSNATIREKLQERHETYRSTIYKELSDAFHTNVDSMGLALAYRDYILTAQQYAQDIHVNISQEGMKLLAEMYSLVYYQQFNGDLFVARVLCHALLREISQYINESMQAYENGDDPDNTLSMVSYIMHDTNILPLLRLLNYSIDTYSVEMPYASSLVFEIVEKEPNTDEFVVRIAYNDQKIKWNNQANEISLPAFLEWCKSMLVPDFMNTCHVPPADDSGQTPWSAIIIVVGGAVLIIIIILIIYFCNKKRKDANPESAEHKDAALPIQETEEVKQ